MIVSAEGCLCVGQGWPATMLAMVGKGFVTISYNAIYVFSAEIFPTEVRNAAMGMASGCARLSTMAAPFVGAPMVRRGLARRRFAIHLFLMNKSI